MFPGIRRRWSTADSTAIYMYIFYIIQTIILVLRFASGGKRAAHPSYLPPSIVRRPNFFHSLPSDDYVCEQIFADRKFYDRDQTGESGVRSASTNDEIRVGS